MSDTATTYTVASALLPVAQKIGGVLEIYPSRMPSPSDTSTELLLELANGQRFTVTIANVAPFPVSSCRYSTLYAGELFCDVHDSAYPCPGTTLDDYARNGE